MFGRWKVLLIGLILGLILGPALGLGAAELVDLKVGPTAMMKTPVDVQAIDQDYLSNLDVDDFAFGLDTRFRISIFSVNLAAVISQGASCADDDRNTDGDSADNEVVGMLIESYLNLGLTHNLGPLQLGLYGGPQLDFFVHPGKKEINLTSDDLFENGVNLRFTGDLLIGGGSVGFSYAINSTMRLDDMDWSNLGSMFSADKGRLGVTVLSSLW